MPQGLIPSNDRWEVQWFASTDTTNTFRRFELVRLMNDYSVSVMSSHASQPLGIALSSSTNSQPIRGINMVPVAVPLFGAKAYADVDTGVTASDLSIGKKITISKPVAQGTGLFSFASTVIGQASRFSAYAQVVGPIDTDLSRVEVSFNAENVTFYSTSSVTMA